ncbi:DNA processing protein DprA [Corynebacterium provencense]|uniref:DNA processing protein DprA n=2 Tax=Corynebacterium provencense TaxID=1737425 RepID=A0A2Z3YR76_9CORY|nr:DNA processing protein DprA [Corynebacterium provencense]
MVASPPAIVGAMTQPANDLRHVADMLRFSLSDVGLTGPRKVEEIRRLGDMKLVDREWDINDDLTPYLTRVSNWQQRGYTITSILDRDYPELLREVREAPPLIFTQGALLPEERGASIVGSRDAAPGALAAARDVAGHLVELGLPVISGLAAGIDSAAHEGALDAGGRTVAIMGTGLDHTFPASNRELRQRIIDQDGLVLSQFLPEENGSKRSFPMRNAVMSGYGIATIVIAATEKSGTHHQARAAVKHGRGLIFTAKVATEVSWARALVKDGLAVIAHSPREAADLAAGMLEARDRELSLF